MAAGLPPSPALDPSITAGQSGHTTDHEVIAGTLALLKEAAGKTVTELAADAAFTGTFAAATRPTGTDATAVEAALDSLRGAGGLLQLDPGTTYTLATGVAWVTDTDGPLVVMAHGARIEYSGSGVCFDISATVAEGDEPRVKVYGGHWLDTGTGTACFRITDATGTTIDVDRIEDFTAGIVIRNDSFWSEQTTIGDVAFPNCTRALDFEPASVSGGTGTESFARTMVGNIKIGHGVSGEAQIRCRGGVYDSHFGKVTGNIGDGVIVYSLAGTMGGTVIEPPAVENNVGPTNYDGTLFSWGTFTGSAPSIRGPITLRNSIVLNSGTPLSEAGRTASKVSRVRTTDGTPVNASTTLVADDVLTIPVAASSKYDVEALLMCDGSIAGDWKIKFDAPAGSTLYWVPDGPSTGSTAGSGNVGVDKKRYALANSAPMGALGAGTPAVASIRGTLITGATAGSLTVYMAQNTSDASNTFLAAGSSLHLTPIVTT